MKNTKRSRVLPGIVAVLLIVAIAYSGYVFYTGNVFLGLLQGKVLQPDETASAVEVTQELQEEMTRLSSETEDELFTAEEAVADTQEDLETAHKALDDITSLKDETETILNFTGGGITSAKANPAGANVDIESATLQNKPLSIYSNTKKAIASTKSVLNIARTDFQSTTASAIASTKEVLATTQTNLAARGEKLMIAVQDDPASALASLAESISATQAELAAAKEELQSIASSVQNEIGSSSTSIRDALAMTQTDLTAIKDDLADLLSGLF